ncbi:hypothetical protein MMC34_006757 [Xylographa carneopallida]|nr:hypothetical protein [Xylographa carneopallida]
MEVTGLAVGVVALASLFTTCVECWDYVGAARSHGRDYELLATRLEVEKTRFLIWGDTVGLLKPGRNGCDVDLESPMVKEAIERCLTCIQSIFTDSKALSSRYGLLEKDLPDFKINRVSLSSNQFLKFKASYKQFQARVKGVQQKTDFLGKTRWAIHDRTKFSILVDDLRGFIDSLKDITNSITTRTLQQRVIAEELESLPDINILRLVKEATAGFHEDWSDTATEILEMSILGHEDARMDIRVDIEDWIPDPGAQKVLETLAKDGRDANIENLHWAVENGHGDVVTFLLDMGADIEAKDDKNNETPLTTASRFGQMDVVEILLKKGASIDGGRLDGEPILLSAAWCENTGLVDLLLQYGADVDARLQRNGATSLNEAARHGHDAMMQCLLQGGADIEAKDFNSYTPLVWAVKESRTRAVKVLLEHGANANVNDDKSISVLTRAAIQGRTDIAQLLIDKGANLEARLPSPKFRTPLHEAAWSGHEEMVRMLVRNGADIEAREGEGKTALFRSAQHNQARLVEFLLGNKANTEVQDKWERLTPLIFAARAGAAEVVEVLVKAGANIEVQTKGHVTALNEAASCGHDKIAQTLLAVGANIEATDNTLRTPLFRAVDGGRTSVVKTLLEAGAKTEARRKSDQCETPLLYAAWFLGKEEILELLLRHKANIGAKDMNGRTALIRAACRGYEQNVKMLLEHGANIDAQDNFGGTAIMRAVDYGHKSMLRFLAAKGANVRARDRYQRTLLHSAAKNERTSLILDIIRLGVDINAVGSENESALWDAVRKGNAEIVKMLIERGASETIATKSGETPFLLAIRKGDDKVAQLFP